MVTKQFFLCVVLSLIGCNHLVQHNMFPSSRSTLPSGFHAQHSAPHLFDSTPQDSALLLDYYVDFANLLNYRGHIFESSALAAAYMMTTTLAGGDAMTVARAAEGAAGNAILSLDSLVRTVAYVLDSKPNNINSDTLRDINLRTARLGLALTPEFRDLCCILHTDNFWTPEAVAKLSTAYAICAFCSAYRAHATLMNTTYCSSCLYCC